MTIGERKRDSERERGRERFLCWLEGLLSRHGSLLEKGERDGRRTERCALFVVDVVRIMVGESVISVYALMRLCLLTAWLPRCARGFDGSGDRERGGERERNREREKQIKRERTHPD